MIPLNSWLYPSLMCIDLVIEFWEKFCLTSMRQKYNYCKHKGKPTYSEIEKLRDGKMVNIYINKKAIGKKIQIASDIGDVQYHFSLIEGIRELYKFDDEVLFPYIKVLFNKLEQVIQPSPIV
jgi:hypothetical protein